MQVCVAQIGIANAGVLPPVKDKTGYLPKSDGPFLPQEAEQYPDNRGTDGDLCPG